jgi:outer membrane protein
MKKAGVVPPLAVAVVLLLAAAAFAQQAVKIAVINSQQAFEQSVEGKKAAAQMQDRDTQIKANIQKLDDAVRVLQNKMSTGRLTMTQEALVALQSDIDKKQTERKRYEEDATREFQQFQFNLVQKIREEMVTIIKALRTERGYDIVLDLQASGTVDFNPTIDITDEIVRRYDASKAGAPPVKK